MQFRQECGRCHLPLVDDDPAYLCARECTFCPTCYRQLNYTCPNCQGELVRRPRRRMAGRAAPRAIGSGSREVVVRRATVDDVDAVVPLFEGYRRFYQQPSDPVAARRFLSDRLARHESVLLMAVEGSRAVGFTQLYPLFSSLSLGPLYVLNDLFVLPEARRRGVGASLLEAARDHGRREAAHYLELSTAVDNPAQHLYEAQGWMLDREFLHYELRPRPEERDR